MITLADYFGKWVGHKDATDEVVSNAEELLEKVNAVLDTAFTDGIDLMMNPATNSLVSGQQYGGFRPQSCPIGAPQSAHKQGKAVDIYDPQDVLDKWCFANQRILKSLGLCMEHPSATHKWCHLSTRYPASGKVCFTP